MKNHHFSSIYISTLLFLKVNNRSRCNVLMWKFHPIWIFVFGVVYIVLALYSITFSKSHSLSHRISTVYSCVCVFISLYLCDDIPNSSKRKTNASFLSLSLSTSTELKTWRIAQLFEKVSTCDERRRCLLCSKIVCNVRNHYYVHFPGKYSCTLCSAVYTRSDTLLMHCRSKHPEQY